MKKVLIWLGMVAGLLLLASQATAWCSYGSDSSYGHNFLEIVGGKISVYEERVALNIQVKFARRSYQWCGRNFAPIKRDDAVKISCKLSRNDDIILKGKLQETMDTYAYKGMVIGKIYSPSVTDDIADYLDDESSSIKCSVYGNDTFVKVKIIDKR